MQITLSPPQFQYVQNQTTDKQAGIANAWRHSVRECQCCRYTYYVATTVNSYIGFEYQAKAHTQPVGVSRAKCEGKRFLSAKGEDNTQTALIGCNSASQVQPMFDIPYLFYDFVIIANVKLETKQFHFFATECK